MHFKFFGGFFFVLSFELIKLSLACAVPPDYASGVISLLNVTVRSEASNDSGIVGSGLATISVNNKSYAPQTKGYNVVVFDALSGRFLTSNAFDCVDSQAKCDELGVFLASLPQDVIVLLAIQDSAVANSHRLPISNLKAIGAQHAGDVVAQTSHAVIGYKGQQVMAWKDELWKGSGQGPAEVSSSIPISCSYVPEDSTTCTPFNVASQMYGSSCLNQSSRSGAPNDCKYVLDGTTTMGWQSATNEGVNAFVTIGFHTTFIINKLRIMQKTASGQQIQEILLDFSDCSMEKITLAGNKTDFEEFTLLSRRASWVRLTVTKVYDGSGGVGITEIEFHNDMCKQKTICDVVKLSNNSKSDRYRLHSTKFPLMINARDKVSVLLTSTSRDSSLQYQIVIGSNGNIVLHKKAGEQRKTLTESNVTAPLLKENEMRIFWIDIEKNRVVFGSGEKIYLFWRDAELVNIKYAFLSTTTSGAIFKICGRVGQCYKGASHYWPLDKSIIFIQDTQGDGSQVGRIHGPWNIQEAPTKLGITPQGLYLPGVSSWVDFGEFKDNCIISPSKCPKGISVSFKASVTGNETGYILSSKGLAVFYTGTTMYFYIRDGQKYWQVHGSFQKNTWQTFSMSWSQENGLTAVVVGNTSTVLRDTWGKSVTPSTDDETTFAIGRSMSKSGEYAECVIRDLAAWEEEITEEKMSKLHICSDPETCAQGWEYFDGSCYKIVSESLAFASARNSCVSQGADLVKISSEEENSFLTEKALDEAWIGLEKAQDNSFYWQDGSGMSFSKWKDGLPASNACVIMDANGTWRDSQCSFTPNKYICEQVPPYYLGCYEDDAISPAFVFNPGDYKPSAMTPGLCMDACGTAYFTYAGLKGGSVCLCSNATVPANERSSDMCNVPCLGSGNPKCGGVTHISVYKTVQVRPMSLTLSSDPDVTTLVAFNLTLTPVLPADRTVESYTINAGDGTTYHTTQSVATLAFFSPGDYQIQGKMKIKHCDSGHQSAVESSTTVSAVSNATDIEFVCPAVVSVNFTFSCLLKFSRGANVKTKIQFKDGEDHSCSVPDAEIMTVGIPSACSGSQISTSDGLYLLAGMKITNKGEAIALEMDVERGGFLDVKVYRPKCLSVDQRYCGGSDLCVASYQMINASVCPANKPNSCENGETFSFTEGQCTNQSETRSDNTTVAHGNFDYEHISSYRVYTTTGQKLIFIETKSQRFQLQEGDLIGVRFPATGPAAALKTSLSSFSFLYSSSVLNITGTNTLRGNRLPLTEDSPTKVNYAPAVAVRYSAASETYFENRYQKAGHEKVSITVENARKKVSFTKDIAVQQEITGLELKLPDVFPSAEVVNISVEILYGTNVSYVWDFGDGKNATTTNPWVTHLFEVTGPVVVNLIATNRVSLVSIWCSTVVQERIAGLEFRHNALSAIQNGTTASIGWLLRNGSHVDFNISVDSPEGENHTANLTNAKAPGATFFAIYKTNITIPGLYLVTITAVNKLDDVSIKGNLSVQRIISGISVMHPGIVKTNETFNFTVLPHTGEETARYFLLTMDGNTINTTRKIISHTYRKGGRYKVSFIASNDISSTVANCQELIVEDVIEGLEFESFDHNVGVMAEVRVHWKLSQGSEISILVDYGDGVKELFRENITVADIFLAISSHNYSTPGNYLFQVTVRNDVSNKTINTTIHVETPVRGSQLAVGRGSLPKAEGGPCAKGEALYIAVNETVTATVTVSNGTNINAVFGFGNGSLNNLTYSDREFPENGTTSTHFFSEAGEYNITVTLFNRNPKNETFTCKLIVQNPISGVKLKSDSPKPSFPGSVGFQVEFPSRFRPSRPLYFSYSFGDNAFRNHSENSIIHTYAGQGVYIATVEVANEISFGNASVEVKVQDKVHGLNFTANVTDYVNECPQSWNFVPQTGMFPLEYDIFFKASITSGTNVTYTWTFPDGHKIKGSSCRRKFNSTGVHIISLLAKNEVSNDTKEMEITVEESIRGVSLKNDGPAVEDQLLNFTLRMQTKGNNSCFAIDLKDLKDNIETKYKTGTPSDCEGAKNLKSPEKFTHTYTKAQDYNVTLTAKNRVSCVRIKNHDSKASVVKGPCNYPKITAEIGKSKETRTKYKRSEKINIKTTNKIKCYNLTTSYGWQISQLQDDTSKSLSSYLQSKGVKIDISDLIIPARVLEYGLYELRFLIKMELEPGVFTEEKFYIEVTKSELLAIIDGGTERTVGNVAPLDLNAVKSNDPDSEVQDNSGYNYSWFCKRRGDTNYNLPTTLTILPPIPTPSNESLGGCFDDGPGRLNFTSLKITLNTSRMTPNTTYYFRFVMMKDDRHRFTDQIVTISPGDPPSLSIECQKCEVSEKINPSSKLTFRGHGRSSTNKKISYKWELKKLNCSKDEENCGKIQEEVLKTFASTSLNAESLVIKPDKLEGGKEYEFTLIGWIDGGIKGNSKRKIIMNESPKNGKCIVKPTEGKPLEPKFTLNCSGFKDDETPLQYEFFYSKGGEGHRNETLGSGPEASRERVTFPSGLQEKEYMLKLYAKISDRLGASRMVEFESPVKVKRVEMNVDEIERKAKAQLDSLANAGNTRETASMVQSIAEVLNDDGGKSKPEKSTNNNNEKKKEVRELLVKVLIETQSVSGSLSDITLFTNTLATVTSKPEENSETVEEKVAKVMKAASAKILEQASDQASSEEVVEASRSVLNGGANIITSAAESQKSGEVGRRLRRNTQKTSAEKAPTGTILGTFDQLSTAVSASMVPGEEPQKLTAGPISLGCSRVKNGDNGGPGSKPLKIGDSEVTIPQNLTVFGNKTLDVQQLVSEINYYPERELNNSKLVSISFRESDGDNNHSKVNVKDLEEGKEISVMVPRTKPDTDRLTVQGELKSGKFNEHEFEIHDNVSALIIELSPDLAVDIELYVKKGDVPNPSKNAYDYNVTLSVGELTPGVRVRVDNSSNSTGPSYSYEYLLSNEDLNWTAAGTYFALVRYKEPKNHSFTEEELKKISYNFSVITCSCWYFNEENEVWSTEGVKVGPKTTISATECLTTHLTTFGSNFFVPPNKINFEKLTPEQLLESPHALIAVCIILGLYLLCLAAARRADKNDALKTGVSPLPDNDSRDTYCYEIQVHTGFVRGAGSSAEVSIVVTGALGDSEPRVLKDPKRKTFKTGAVDAFLLTVPQSLGNLKQIRVWHNNGGNYPSWNLLRIMMQDIQTDQRWWFVCDDWLAVDEGDGKIERNLFPASKKDLTKFNVLFTSEVRKNLTDGHIWFSVVTRPPRSTFTRVQRLTCCLSILLCTMLANAMFYKVGENETPINSIKIMGFSFSIRQVSIGIMSSLIVFPANLIIVTIFRKAKPKENRYAVKTESEDIDNVDVEIGGERKKAPPMKGLPHWFVYVAYAIAFLTVATSASFVIIYGMVFGPEKSAQWLSSMTVSFLQDVLLTQPVKVFLLAMLFALLIKDPKKAEENSYADINALANDEEWLHKNTEDLDPEMQKTLKTLINDKPPDEAKLEIARQLRMKERQMKSIIQEIAWYVIFLLVLLTISYGNRDLITSQVTRYMQNTFVDATFSENLTYTKVHEISHYWKWMNEVFIPSLDPHTYYDGVTPYESNFLADTPNAYLLGLARLRQLRIKKDTCEYKRVFHHIIPECNDFYNMDDEDQGSYLPGWKGKPLVPPPNGSITPVRTTSETPHPKGPWIYQSGDELKTYPYWGYKATYSAGGFVQNLPNDANDSMKITGNLSDSRWLDRYTRAIFSEFAIYNANTNLFCVVTLLFEQLPTGSLTSYPSILTLRLFRYVGGEMYFVLTCEIVYLMFCVFFVVKEIRLFVKKGKEHLKNPWSVLEMFVTLLSLTAVGLYFARMKFTNDALRDMNDDHSGFVSFHYTAFLDEWLKCIIGIIVFLSFLKLFRLLRFNRRMSLLQQVLKRCFTQLISFLFMFALAFLAFALLACLVFGQSMEGFGTFLTSCASLMDTILGKFTLKGMMEANRIIGPIFFITYTISMVFVLINMFLSIINDAFTEVRSDVEKQSNEYEIVDFMIHRLKENIGKSIGHAIHPVYKEPKSELEVNFDKIADNADNAMHFMRNIAFEDMRKTRWFQTDNCTDKKKNLIRLLMEVEWDYYEEELCDSIPVFERFLNQYSNEELENILQSYQQKRMVEDIVYDRVNGEEDEESSDRSDSDDSNGDSNGSISDDDKSSNNENESGTEQVVEDGMRLLTPGLGYKPNSAKSHRESLTDGFVESEPNKIRSPLLLVTDSEPITAEEMNQQAQNIKRESLCVDPYTVASENELVKILQDVKRDVESRCATDAEIESIFGDSLSADGIKPLKFDSEPENTGSKKSVTKKRRKKKTEEKEVPEERSPRDAWVATTNDKAEDDAATGEPEEKPEKKKENKAKKNPKTKRKPSDPCVGDDEADEEVPKSKKKPKEKAATEVEGEAEQTKKKKKKKKAESSSGVLTEENAEEETNEGQGKERKKETKKKNQETSQEKQEQASQAGGKKKKTKAKKKLATVEDDGHASIASNETVETVVEEKAKKKKKKDNKDDELCKEESEC